MTTVDNLMAKALADAPPTTVSVVIPGSQRFLVTTPRPALDQPCYVLPVAPHMIPCYEVLHDLSPELPYTTQACRFYTVPKDWERVMSLERVPLIDHALDYPDEPTTVLLLAVAMKRINDGDPTPATIYVRNLCASRLTILEAAHVCKRVEQEKRSKSLSARQLTAFEYLTTYWPIVAIGHLQLAGTEYNSSMMEDFLSAQRSVARALKAVNT